MRFAFPIFIMAVLVTAGCSIEDKARPESRIPPATQLSDRVGPIGACCDTGHWVRSGLAPVECLKKLEGRILGFHLKDAAEMGNRESRDMPLGEGKADYAAVLKELNRQGYRGVVAIEYEHDSPELKSDVAKCVAFVEKTSQALNGQ